MKRIGTLSLHGCLFLSMGLAGSGGCRGDDGGALQPVPRDAAYRSALSSDPGRAGEFRPGGLLGTAPTPDAAPVDPVAPTAAPATTRAAAPAPQYIQLGAVIAEVNGKPIYAHKVLLLVGPSLRPAALQLDARAFRTRARDEIRKQRDELIRDELYYAAADRETTPDEKRQAQLITGRHFDELVSAAGGSEALARQKADSDADGLTFDEELDRYRRGVLTAIYDEKRLRPRARASIDELRSYYIRNRDARFTTPAVAKFRIIRLDVAQIGGDAAAQKRADEIKARVAAGVEFAALAGDYNSDEGMRRAQGELPPFSRGSFRVKEVEDAVWQTEVGQVTAPIRVGGSIYLAQPTEIKPAAVRAFEDVTVQDEIRRQIEKEKMLALRERQNQQLISDAVLRSDDAALDNAVAMAMQLYAQWRAEAGVR